MKVLTFAATNTIQSINKTLVKYAATHLEGADIDFVDINDYDLPIYSFDLEEKLGVPDAAHAFLARIAQAGAILVSFAEHNGNYTVAFKNLFDWMSRVDRNIYQNKPIVMLATSPGAGGGQHVLKLAENSAPHFGGQVKGTLSIPSFYDNFDAEAGKLVNAELVDALESVLSTLKEPVDV
ncbi:NADPH-dependent FMN reductase [Veronia pacifica]|uniref:NADPH-dependent FMN reductase n=1 Tax=Veronia pacifica TaxID=1080227 RepID=A0A1C3ESJ6_9GAMM|nr:NAD(P)H-dependent oxidoreductase [Veronia pacifica]ODA36188.1 NADPH-dependent FMN reductase [Veronia pacifica]